MTRGSESREGRNRSTSCLEVLKWDGGSHLCGPINVRGKKRRIHPLTY